MPESLFSGMDSQGQIVSNAETPFGNVYAAAFDSFGSEQPVQAFSMDDFLMLDEPILLLTSGASTTAMGNLAIHDSILAGKYDVVVKWEGRE